jgi:HEAT repeat protein
LISELESTMNTFRKLLLSVIVPVLFCAYSLNVAAQEFSEEEVNRLIENLDTQDELQYEATVDTLSAFGLPAVPTLINALESDIFLVQRGVRKALAGMGEPVVPAMLDAMESSSPQIRRNAARTLVDEDLNDSLIYAEAIHYALLKALSDPDERVRVSAGKALWEMTDESAAPSFEDDDKQSVFLTNLVKKLSDPDRDVRASAVQSLSVAVDTEPQTSISDLVSDLTTALNDESPYVRRIAAYTLGRIGEPAYVAIPQLIQALDDPDPMVRSATAWAFQDIGALAKEAMPQLQSLLNDPDLSVRGHAAMALAILGDSSEPVIRALREALKFPDEDTREQAAFTLGLVGQSGQVAFPELQELLKDNFPEVRRAASLALGRIGEPAAAAVPGLVDAIDDSDPLVRTNTVRALGRMGEAANIAVPGLRGALDDSYPTVRAHAARSLGQLGYEPGKAIPELSRLLDDPNQLARQFSAEALAKMAIRLQDKSADMTQGELGKAVSNLDVARQGLETAAATDKENANEYRDALGTVNLTIAALNTERYGLFYRLFENKLLMGIVAYLVLLPIFWWLLLWLRPLWLFHVNHALEPYEFAAPRALSEKNRFSTRYILLAGFYYYHPRVLDAWVKSQLPTIRDTFRSKTPAKLHGANISLPITLDGVLSTAPSASDLVPTFSRQPSCLLIWGEGGSGKTFLATETARMAMAEDENQRLTQHPMFPILLDQEIGSKPAKGEKAKNDAPSPLVEVVRGRLQNLTHSPEPLSAGVVTALLKRPSILLVVTDLSEKSKASQEQIRPELPDFPVNALVVTSRVDELLGQVMKTTIHTQRISAAQYPSLLESYVTTLGKDGLFDESGYAEAGHEFSRIVGRYKVPVLFAELHAERTITARESATGTTVSPGEPALPGNVPELIFSYLNEINPGIDVEYFHDTAYLIAWESLKEYLRPQTVKRKNILDILGGGEDAEEQLKYLAGDLNIMETVGASKGRYRFNMELFAEYFAAMHLIETRGSDEASWREFLQLADGIPGAPATVNDFLQALRLCCQSSVQQVPGFLLDELSSRIDSGTVPTGEAATVSGTES